ncbi:hypothetical protein OBBRIDRAFT_417303 [Obba rivulosa]|uniref:Uncharacterized protein n=1 Tax=Obba rivulosa TaxID=1052685 RepID=A0A8E2DME7_9APHY|nr:hypothetical protein OBBRIDRAFT_417303 [Obba rivulosa]
MVPRIVFVTAESARAAGRLRPRPATRRARASTRRVASLAAAVARSRGSLLSSAVRLFVAPFCLSALAATTSIICSVVMPRAHSRTMHAQNNAAIVQHTLSSPRTRATASEPHAAVPEPVSGRPSISGRCLARAEQLGLPTRSAQ